MHEGSDFRESGTRERRSAREGAGDFGGGIEASRPFPREYRREAMSEFIFIVAFCGFAYLISEIVKAYRSPECQRDLERLREQRRLKRAARRNR
jgi:hypothetical protein